MRLALLTHEPFYPPSGGGSAEANYLVNELTRRGHEVHLFCPDFPDRDAVATRFGVYKICGPHELVSHKRSLEFRWVNAGALVACDFVINR